MPPPFSLRVHSLARPSLPQQIGAMPLPDIRSPLLTHALATTSALSFIISLPDGSTSNPLFPATHLQLQYHYEGSGDIFVPTLITPKDLVQVTSTPEALYQIEVPPTEIPRAKVNHGATSTAELRVHAWKGERMLGSWIVGEIENLGIVGYKSNDLAILRAEARQTAKVKAGTAP